MRRKSLRILLISISLVSLVLLAASFSQVSQELHIRVWTDKDEYIPREPIIVHYEVQNIADRIVRLDFWALNKYFNIKDQEGKRYATQLIVSSDVEYPDSLRPGESYRNSKNITDSYGVISSGEYTCFLNNPSPQAKSNIIKIEVKEPEGKEKEALNLLLEAQNLASVDTNLGYPHPGKEELAVMKCQQIVDRYPNRVYAPMGLLTAIEIRARWYEQRKRVIPMCVRLIERYPDYYYWSKGFSHLVEAYESLRDKEGAINTLNELIEKHPNTKISERAQYWLKKIEEWEFE